MVLDGDELKLVSIAIDGKALADNSYVATPDQLEISDLPEGKRFTLEIVTEINPTTNRQLSGLYRSSGVYCTQCEAEGFRRITYYYDRPDVLSVYTVRVDADKQAAPFSCPMATPLTADRSKATRTGTSQSGTIHTQNRPISLHSLPDRLAS